MQAKINKEGKVEFHLEDLIDCLSLQSILEFAESASCYDKVIKHVADQIFTGWTENSYKGSDYEGGPELTTEIGKARARVIEFADDLAKKEIKRLKKLLTIAQNDVKEAEEKYWELYHTKQSNF